MSDKHYTIGYLEDTGRFLKELKEYSYHPFTSVTEGTVIDLGCGTGIDVLKMAEVLGSDVNVVGIDHDPEMLAKGRASAGENSRVEFVLSEAAPIPFHDGSAQGIRAERLIQHLLNAEVVMEEIHRVLAPDSPLVIVETDWPGLIFYNEHLRVEKKVTAYLTEKKINNGTAARRLTSYLEEAGFREIRQEIFPFVIRSLKEANEYLWIGRILAETADNGFISREEHDVFLAALEHADTKGYFACAINVVVASCIK